MLASTPIFNLAYLTGPLLDLDIPGIKSHRGKVRRTFDVDAHRLLQVASDTISAHDVVMIDGIPGKGKILTQMSLFWNEKLHELLGADSFNYHLLSASTTDYPPGFQPHAQALVGRSMLVKRVNIVPIESIVRGYLAGSGLKEYSKSQTVCGIKLPDGLVDSSKLPESLWTPSTKAGEGQHDENISPREAVDVIEDWLLHNPLVKWNSTPAQLVHDLAHTSVLLYETAAEYARSCGIIIADTKFEFGLDEFGNLVLADEVLTPDSSRFWDLESYEPGRTQASFDKQLLRDYLDLLVKYKLWNKQAPAPAVPLQIQLATTCMYLTAYWRLTGVDLTAAA